MTKKRIKYNKFCKGLKLELNKATFKDTVYLKSYTFLFISSICATQI